jgi:hypothetical protein
MAEPLVLNTNLKKNPRSAKLYKRIQQELGFLFEAGFYLAHCDDASSFDWCSVVLQGKYCQVQFSVDRGDVNCAFGPVDGYRDHRTYNYRDWFYIYSVVNFIDQTPFDKYRTEFLDIDQNVNRKDRIGWTLKNFAAALKPRFDKVLKMFSDEETYKDQLSAYMRDIRRQKSGEYFNKQFSQPSQNDFGRPSGYFSGIRFLNLLIVLFVLLVILAFVFFLVNTYRFL